MKQHRLLQQVIGLTFVLLALLACNAFNPRVPSASTPSPIPPSATSIPVIPTLTIAPEPTATENPVLSSVTQQNPKKYRVEFIATLKNDGFTTNKLLVYQPRPINWDGQLDVNIETVSPEPSKQGEDPVFGNGQYYWNITNGMPGIG